MNLAVIMVAALTALPFSFVPPPILMYHRVDVDHPRAPIGRQLTVTPGQLQLQLAYLRAQGISAISMADLDRRLRDGGDLGRVVVLTFDDGYADQYRYAVPLLRRYGARATFYIVTNNVGRPGHVTWNELRAMVTDGMDVAAHGVRHDDLSLMTSAQQRFQVDDSVRVLERRLHIAIDSYAYPSGRFDAETLQAVRHAEIPLAVTTDPHFVIPPENRLEMTRVRVRGDWGIVQFEDGVEQALTHAAIVKN